jgi:hypothetical protein
VAHGIQFPKITAARAMKPRPAVMFVENCDRSPMERYAPPTAARTPDVITMA